MTSQRLLVLVHAFYLDLWDEIARLLHNLDGEAFDLRVNVVDGRTTTEWRDAVRHDFPRAQVYVSPNLGQDIGGTLNLLRDVDLGRYDLVCKLHTKRSGYSAEGEQWRIDLLRACLHEPAEVFRIFAQRPEVTMIGSAAWLGNGNGINHRQCLRLCERLRIEPRLAVSPWLAGSMFWCRPYIMQRLKDARFDQMEFKVGYGRDGTLAHAIERIFGALAREREEIHWRHV